MMGPDKNSPADFFEESPLDPIQAAIGGKPAPVAKKKAGFYLSIKLLDRFTMKFHELKLAGIPIENKSALVEAALNFALDDIDQREQSRVLQSLRP
jgi:hypothetical protein